MNLTYNEACTLKNSNLERDIILCDRVGYDFIEPRIDKLREYLSTHSLDELKRLFAERRIKPGTINGIYVYAGFLGENDDDRRKEALMDDFLFGCRIGHAIGSNSLIVVPDLNRDEEENRPYEMPWNEVFQNTVRILSKLSQVAENSGMSIGVEVVGSKRCSVRTIEQCSQIVNAVGKRNVGYTIDAFNLFLNEKLNDFNCLRSLDSKQIFVVHINDGEDLPIKELRQANRTFCGQGVIDLRNFIGNLIAIGYDGLISIELFRPDCWDKPAEWVIQKTYESTKSALQRYGALR